MAQLNVTIDDALAAAADRLAALRETTRPELMRLLLCEAIAAQEDGRPLFSPPTAPADLAALGELAHRMDQLAMDLDRALREHDKREARLARQHTASEEAIRAAQKKLADQINQRLGETLGPFKAELNALATTLAKQSKATRTLLAAHPGFAEISQELTRLGQQIHTARPHVTYQFGLGGEADRWDIGVGLLAAFGVSIFVLVLFARVLPDAWVAGPVARSLFGSTTRAVCVVDGGMFGDGICRYRGGRQAEGQP